MSEEKVYKGLLKKGTNSEDEDVLLLNEEILAELIEEDIDKFGRYVSVSYYISNVEVENPEKEFVKTLYGLGDAKYRMHYSEITGYLWTDEDLNIGGHDLLSELTSSIGKFLYLKVSYSHEANNPS